MKTHCDAAVKRHTQKIIELNQECLALQIEASKLRAASMGEHIRYDKAEVLFTEASELYLKADKISKRIKQLHQDFYDDEEAPQSLIKRVIAFIKYPIGR